MLVWITLDVVRYTESQRRKKIEVSISSQQGYVTKPTSRDTSNSLC